MLYSLSEILLSFQDEEIKNDEYHRRVDSGEDIVGHHAVATRQAFHGAYAQGFDDVEEAEEGE